MQSFKQRTPSGNGMFYFSPTPRATDITVDDTDNSNAMKEWNDTLKYALELASFRSSDNLIKSCNFSLAVFLGDGIVSAALTKPLPFLAKTLLPLNVLHAKPLIEDVPFLLP